MFAVLILVRAAIDLPGGVQFPPDSTIVLKNLHYRSEHAQGAGTLQHGPNWVFERFVWYFKGLTDVRPSSYSHQRSSHCCQVCDKFRKI